MKSPLDTLKLPKGTLHALLGSLLPFTSIFPPILKTFENSSLTFASFMDYMGEWLLVCLAIWEEEAFALHPSIILWLCISKDPVKCVHLRSVFRTNQNRNNKYNSTPFTMDIWYLCENLYQIFLKKLDNFFLHFIYEVHVRTSRRIQL